MRRIRNILVRHGRSDFRQPTLKCVTRSHHRRRDNRRSIIAYLAPSATPAVRVKRHGVRVDLPLRSVCRIIRGYGCWNCRRPSSESVAHTRHNRCGKRGIVVTRLAPSANASVCVKGNLVLLRSPLRRVGDIIVGHGCSHFRQPSSKIIPRSRHRRYHNRRAIVLRATSSARSTVRVERNRVCIDLPLRRVCRIIRGHCCRDSRRPFGESIAHTRHDRSDDRRVVVPRFAPSANTSVCVKDNLILLRRPLRRISDIVVWHGCRHFRRPPREIIPCPCHRRRDNRRAVIAHLAPSANATIRVKRNGVRIDLPLRRVCRVVCGNGIWHCGRPSG